MKLYSACLKKKYYSSFELAISVSERCMKERPGTKLRVYGCRFCGKYHITSRP